MTAADPHPRNAIARVRYAPPGEYVKDHGLIQHAGLWHLFSISGGLGHTWQDVGHEERISHSTSRDLIHWEMRGHPVQASQQAGFNDEHMAVAPFVVCGHDQRFYMFYSGWRHPHKRPHFSLEGHHQSIYVAVSRDLFQWDIPEAVKPKGILVIGGDPIVGRDPHVLWDDERGRWLLFYTDESLGQRPPAVWVAESADLMAWRNLGPALVWDGDLMPFSPVESPFVLRHPHSGKYLLFLNWHYAVSDEPLHFQKAQRLPFRCGIERLPNAPGDYAGGCDYEGVGVGFAREIIEHERQMYMSGVMGRDGHMVLGFTPFSWTDEFLKLDGE
ncbi:MAG: family 43 glycosylhydrolase [Verrucomicrobia bacterium]|nr:family 43 glycosylhydrolase [Verrucomicrobiota bacterium]